MTSTIEPEESTTDANLDGLARNVARMVRHAQFNGRCRRFIMRATLGKPRDTARFRRKRRKLQTRLRQVNFRRMALLELMDFCSVHAKTFQFRRKGGYGKGPMPSSEIAEQVLPAFESIQSDKIKWLPPSLVCMLYPRATAHMICESLGYAPPERAARIVWDGHLGNENWCEWVYASYRCDARRCLHDATVNNHAWNRTLRHSGYMSSYRNARVLVSRQMLRIYPNNSFAAWF